MTTTALTAKGASLLSCHICHLLSRAPISKGQPRCPRCGARLHSRKPNSITRTWALVIAAYVFYIPANVLPVMTTTSIGSTQTDTIMSGVIYFVLNGMWPLALIIFVASICVPIFKLSILTLLLITVQRKSRWRRKDRTRLYRITEAIGRWSMVDIYAITILVALVHMGSLATVSAGPGAVFFAAVVIITIFAATSFDPRLIWDTEELENG